MANQKDITLNQGHATPKNITLRDLPAAPVSTGTAIYLYQGASSAKDILLSSPAVVREAGGGSGAALSGVSTITFTTAGNLTGASALSASSSLTFTTAGELKGAAALSGATTLTFATSGDALAVAAVSGSSGLTFTTAGDLLGSLAASGASSLTFTTAGDLRGALSMSGTTTATFATAGDLTGSSALVGATTITFTTDADLSIAGGGGADLAGSTGLTFTTSGALTGDAALSAATSLTFTASGGLSVSEAVAETPSVTGGGYGGGGGYWWERSTGQTEQAKLSVREQNAKEIAEIEAIERESKEPKKEPERDYRAEIRAFKSELDRAKADAEPITAIAAALASAGQISEEAELRLALQLAEDAENYEDEVLILLLAAA